MFGHFFSEIIISNLSHQTQSYQKYLSSFMSMSEDAVLKFFRPLKLKHVTLMLFQPHWLRNVLMYSK